MQKIPRWFPKFLKLFIIWLFGLSKKCLVIDDNELVSMLRERKGTNANKHKLLITTRGNGILKERFISYETNQKVVNTPKQTKEFYAKEEK